VRNRRAIGTDAAHERARPSGIVDREGGGNGSPTRAGVRVGHGWKGLVRK
jgi:hypothetical protein